MTAKSSFSTTKHSADGTDLKVGRGEKVSECDKNKEKKVKNGKLDMTRVQYNLPQRSINTPRGPGVVSAP